MGKTAKCIWEYKGDMVGNIQKVSDKPEDVIPGSELIVICSPSNASGDILRNIRDYVDDGAYIGQIYGGGGFDIQAQEIFGHLI